MPFETAQPPTIQLPLMFSNVEGHDAHVQVILHDTSVDDTPSDYIPGLVVVGATYNVLNGKDADSKSTTQQVVDWNQSEVRIQIFGGKNYRIPTIVNFTRNTTTDYRSSYGKTSSDYTSSLSVSTGFQSSFPGFSVSASTDYSDSQRENLSHAFTRVTYSLTHYNLSLPPTQQIQALLKPWFVSALNTMDSIDLYKEYGTHLLRSVTIGGRALYLTSTDNRSYNSEMSLEAAANISASYLVASAKVELSVKQKEATESFNESSEHAINIDASEDAYWSYENNTRYLKLTFPTNRNDVWYYITPSHNQYSPVIVTELVPGALAPVKWERAFIGPYDRSEGT
ncbi:hypothetical protein BC835DRAFT_1414277 [Cytidiella melzeri]|nr:hypothetical protein BC835DRAFT_1414277 [Cytidiella melzeri]